MEIIKLWDNVPSLLDEEPTLEYYPSTQKCSNATVIIFPGGAYAVRSEFEGKGYAEFFNTIGMDVFVCQYRIAPNRHPSPLLDGRRAIQYVRFNAEKYGIDKDKIGIMGSSAGGHLVSTLATNEEEFPEVLKIKDDIDNVDFKPNFQILCYPVIALKDYGHIGSGTNLLGNDDLSSIERDKYNAINNIKDWTPIAFIWHTFDDSVVNVKNSLIYAQQLKDNNISTELHIFPHGMHGLGIAPADDHVNQWPTLLKRWLKVKKIY